MPGRSAARLGLAKETRAGEPRQHVDVERDRRARKDGGFPPGADSAAAARSRPSRCGRPAGALSESRRAAVTARGRRCGCSASSPAGRRACRSMGIARLPAGFGARCGCGRRAITGLSLGRSRAGSGSIAIGAVRHGHEQVEQIADPVGDARADVVRRGAAGRADEQPVGADRVAHVGDVAPRLEVADAGAPASPGRPRSRQSAARSST